MPYSAVFRCFNGCEGSYAVTEPMYRCPRCGGLLQVVHDVEELFLPVVGHRILFTPTFLVEIRKHGRQQAAARFVEQCFEVAPRPEAALSGEVLPIAGERAD